MCHPLQDEGDFLRGYPKDDAKCNDVIFVNLGVGGHVAFHGARAEQVRRGDGLVAPTRALVLRLKKARLERQRKAVGDTLAVLEEYCREHGLLVHAFQPSFVLHELVCKLLRTVGGHNFGPNSNSAILRSIDDIQRLLPSVSLLPFQRRRKRNRISKVVIPALLDALAVLVEKGELTALDLAAGVTGAAGAAGTAGAAAAGAGSAVSASELEEEELVLLDMLHAPHDSYLYSLAEVMTRVENLSHVLAWAKYDENADLGASTAISQSDLRLVSLPRLKLTFQSLRKSGAVRLYSVDHADLYITNERNATSALRPGRPLRSPSVAFVAFHVNAQTASSFLLSAPPARFGVGLLPAGGFFRVAGILVRGITACSACPAIYSLRSVRTGRSSGVGAATC